MRLNRNRGTGAKPYAISLTLLLFISAFISGCTETTELFPISGNNNPLDPGYNQEDPPASDQPNDPRNPDEAPIDPPGGGDENPGDPPGGGDDPIGGLDPSAIIFQSGFEKGFEGWDSNGSYTGDTLQIVNDSKQAHSGNRVFMGEFTLSKLASRGSSSVLVSKIFKAPPSGVFYVRYYTRLGEGTIRPHHGGGFRAFSPGNNTSGSAGQRPRGDQKFNSRIDLNENGDLFFYTYWHEMRSWLCNDGSTNSGCAGYNGPSNSPYYGNVFKPANQPSFDPYEWNCIEYKVKINTPNQYDGELSLWANDVHLGTFRKGEPNGHWLRQNFFVDGKYFDPKKAAPFEGFNFRTSSTVNNINVFLEHYQEKGTLDKRRGEVSRVNENQRVYFDDVVIATQRIGCQI